jgi:hypothetical protein
MGLPKRSVAVFSADELDSDDCEGEEVMLVMPLVDVLRRPRPRSVRDQRLS